MRLLYFIKLEISFSKKTTHLFTYLSCVLFPFFLDAQNFQQDSIKGDFYCEQANTLWQNVDTCYYYSKLAVPLLKKTKQWDKYIFTLCGLSYCYNAKSQFDSMEVNNIFAYEEAKRLLPQNHPYYFFALNNLALVYSQVKENDLKALLIYKNAYNLLLAQDNIDFTVKAPVEENIGQMHFRLGDFDTAIKYYQESIKSWQQVRVNGKIKIPFIRLARVYAKVANLYYSLKKYKTSKSYALKCLKTLELANEYNINFKVRSILILTKINIAEGNNDMALAQLNDLQQTPDLPQNLKVRLLYNKGLVFQKKENLSQSIYNLHRGLQVTTQKNQVREKASIHRTLSEIFHSKKDFLQALKHQQKAVKLLTADTSLINDLDIPDSRTIVSSKLDLFKTLVQKGKTIHALYQETKNPIYLKAALNTYLYLSQLTDDIRSFYQSEESQLLLLDEAKDFYEKAMETAFLLYDKNPNQQFLENAFFFTEKSKSELLLEELRKKEFSGKGIIADSLLKKQYNLKVAINYNHKLLKKENRKIEQKNKSKIKDLETTIFNLQKQWSDLKDEINLSYPTYSALTEQLPITLNKMQSKLDDSQVLLEYFVGKKNIYLFKITQQNATLLKIPNDFNLDILLTDLFGNLKMTGTNGISQYSTIAYQLYQKLLQPAQLSSQKNVIIIPDGRLENLPFGILLTKKGNTNSPKDLPYFIKKMATSYAYSATILSYQMSQKTSLASSIIGVFPIFEKTEKELLHSEKIHKSLSRFSGSFLLKEEATKQNFLNNVEDFQIIHFSSHARGKDNIQESPSIDLFDGSLIISDLQTYNLSASLAVLSACETNVGEYRNGEGIMSLSRGFTFAGVPSVITSVSNVMEESTSSIIISLYKNLEKRMPKHEALRQAKLEYLNNPNLPNSECSPYYWGTFLAIGNMDNITFKYKSKNDIWYYVFGTVIFFIVGIFVKRKKSHKSFLVYQSKPKVEN